MVVVLLGFRNCSDGVVFIFYYSFYFTCVKYLCSAKKNSSVYQLHQFPYIFPVKHWFAVLLGFGYPKNRKHYSLSMNSTGSMLQHKLRQLLYKCRYVSHKRVLLNINKIVLFTCKSF